MRLTFSFTSSPDIAEISKHEIFQSHFQFPDSALELPDVESHLNNIATTVGELTQVTLHVTCRDMKWVNRLIKVGEPNVSVWHSRYIAAVAFVHYTGLTNRRESQVLKILSPIKPPYVGRTVKARRLVDVCREIKRWKVPPDYNDYLTKIHTISDSVLILLNHEPSSESITEWDYVGFMPSWSDNSLITERNKRRRAIERELKKQEKEATQKAEVKKTQKGRIYFIQQGNKGAIKIGYSTNPEKRLKTLSTASPYPLHVRLIIEGDKKLEKQLHDKFIEHQLDGEWFEASDAILAYIEAQSLNENQE